MPARALAALAVVLALAVAGASGAAEPKAPATPAAIVEYHDSGEWKSDTTKQVKKAKAFVKKWLANHRRPYKRKPAIVLDIDDTALSLYECAKENDFVGPTACAVQPDLPAIPQVRSLYRYARKHKLAVFFITGRPEPLRALTASGLKGAGYTGKLRLTLRPTDNDDDSTVRYKSGARRKITKDGFRILANLGDQRSDLKGGYSLKAYKLPNPMYFTP
ncbi:MAG TPA: HAD family acid phosphatase [Thermoleophilaceae bacterium]|nr:HAD family acid phosphatase [Thermoleophilaceae bacterium]